MTKTAQPTAAPDATDFLPVMVSGRGIPEQEIRVYELTAGELADCTDELMSIGAAIYANRAAVESLLAKADEAGGQVTIAQIKQTLDVKSISRATSGAFFTMLSKCCAQDDAFVRALKPTPFIELCTAALAMNADFFSTLRALFAVGAAAGTSDGQPQAQK